jgi:hypothetical protein
LETTPGSYEKTEAGIIGPPAVGVRSLRSTEEAHDTGVVRASKILIGVDSVTVKDAGKAILAPKLRDAGAEIVR